MRAEVQHVEDVVRDGYPGEQVRAGRLHVHPLLQRAEAGPAAVVVGDHLAVQHRRHPAEQVAQPGQLRVRAGHVAVVAGQQPQPVRVHVADQPDAVPLELVPEAGVVGRQVGQHREHRPDQLG